MGDTRSSSSVLRLLDGGGGGGGDGGCREGGGTRAGGASSSESKVRSITSDVTVWYLGGILPMLARDVVYERGTEGDNSRLT